MISGKAVLSIAVGLTAVLGFSAASAGEGGSLRTGASAAKACDTYIVQPGDTLGGISRAAFGSAAHVDTIQRMNADRIASADNIAVGMALDLPCAGAPGLTTWTAEAGDFLVPVLTEWGERAGYDVIVENNSDWRFGVDYTSRGDFRVVVDDVIEGFSSAAVPPVIVFYNNNVMTIGAH